MDGRPYVEHAHPHTHCFHKCVSWSSVISGGLVGLGLSFLLNLFSVAIGLTAFSTTGEGVSTFAIGGFIGFVIGVIAALFVAGFVAGYLAKPYCSRHHLGALYGFLAWAVTLILGVLLSASVGKFVSFNADLVNNRAVAIVSGHSEIPVVNNTQNTSIVSAQSADNLSKIAFVTFALFFIGAVSACFGGHAGLSCRKDECDLKNP